MSKNSKNELNEQIRKQMEKLMEKCVIVGILCKNGGGLEEKHREDLAKKLVQEAHDHLIQCEEALYHYNRSRLARAYIKGGKVAEELVC